MAEYEGEDRPWFHGDDDQDGPYGDSEDPDHHPYDEAVDDDDQSGYELSHGAPDGVAFNSTPRKSPKQAGDASAGDDMKRLREELRQEQEERLALEQELSDAKRSYEGLAAEMEALKNKSRDVDMKDNERSTVLEAKLQLENELIELRAEHGEAEAKRKKAEQDLTFEQEVRRAAAANRDEAEQRLAEEQMAKDGVANEVQGLKEQLAGAEQAKRTAEAAAASDRKALEQREEDVMALRIELGEKEAEVRHASKMENLQCSIEYEKLRSELEWKTRMLTNECEDLEGRLEESEGRRRKMEQAVMQANSEMRLRRQEGENMMRMLEQVLTKTEGARVSEDSKLRELSSVRESVQGLKEQAQRQLAALDRMREISLAGEVEQQPARRRRDRFDANSPPPPMGAARQSVTQRSPPRKGSIITSDIFESAELDNQIKQIEDELTIKLPPLDSWQQDSSPSKQLSPPPKRGHGRGRAAGRGRR